MYLNSTAESLQLITTTTAPLHVVANYMDHTATGGDPDSQETIITTASTTTVLAAPGVAGTDRQLRSLTIRNTSDSQVGQVTVVKDVAGTDYEIIRMIMQAGEMLAYSESKAGWSVFTRNGLAKTISADSASTNGLSIPIYKTGTAPEAAGVLYCSSKDAGLPGAWAPGTPGVNGRATDGLSAADAGCICPPDPEAGGFNYLTKLSVSATQSSSFLLYDFLWVNTGLAVNTTTAQAMTPVASASRDQAGTSLGLGIQAALLVTAATTNSAAITNCTITYTNSDGVPGRAGTMPNFPATAVAGTLVFFTLAAGDKGVRSIQSITFGTSLIAGSVSLVLARFIDMVGNPSANSGQLETNSKPSVATGFKIYNRSTMFLVQLPTGTGATNVFGLIGIRQS